MDCLEVDLHQLILSDLALNVGEWKDCADAQPGVESAIEVMTSNVGTRTVTLEETDQQQRVFMSASRVRCNIGFGELAVSMPKAHIDTTVHVLVDILKDVAFVDFDRCLAWDDWALPDQLVFTTVSSLLQLADSQPEYRAKTVSAVLEFVSAIVTVLQTGPAPDVLTQIAPAFHGFYRAVISTPFSWTAEEWNDLSDCLVDLFASNIVERLNTLLTEFSPSGMDDLETSLCVETILARYAARGRPLTGYFVVCCVIEIQWTVLAQVLSPPDTSFSPVEAAAANQAWLALSQKPIVDLKIKDVGLRDALRTSSGHAMQCFADLLAQIEDMESEPSFDTYAWETMAECLKLASICSVALEDLDHIVYARLKQLLSEGSPISDGLVQEAALKATTVLVHNFPTIAPVMTNHLRRFVTSPLPIFEFEFASETRAPPPLAEAAKCLALCIKSTPGDDLILSNMYSLLNYIAATSKELQDESSTFGHGGITSLYGGPSADHSTVQSVETGLRSFTEEQKRLIGISTISVVTRLALEFKVDEVTRLTISMLLQRLRTAEPTVEAAIAYNLVDLALEAPEGSFIDIIRRFSAINRSANPDDPRFSNNMVLAAQTRLAQDLKRREELRVIYLVELLTLFADKGVAIQNLAIANRDVKIDDMIDQLASLLLPIDALLNHEDVTPHKDATIELVGLFRNMWFLCVLFEFTSSSGEGPTEWRKAALRRIAVKSPPIVLEEVNDYVTSAVEYNSVIRQEYAHSIISRHRTLLAKYIPLRTSEVRSLSAGQIVFLLTMHDVESMRSILGLSASLVTYFLNSSLNKSLGMNLCMESIAEKVMRGCVAELSRLVFEHNLPEALSTELRLLLVSSSHRIGKVREISFKYLNRLISSYPSLMCDPPLVFAILEILTILRRACEGEYMDEYNPVHEFHSDWTGLTLQLTDSYKTRNEILTQLLRDSQSWFKLALARAPVEFQATLQKYLSSNHSSVTIDSTELGASVALQFAMAIGPAERKLAPITGSSSWKPDRSKTLTSQIACKEHFIGEAGGLRLAHRGGVDELQKSPPSSAPLAEVEALKRKMSEALEELQRKKSRLTVPDLKRLLFRSAAVLISMSHCDYDLLHYIVALPFQVFTPAAMSAGIEVWTLIIADKSTIEIALMMEINSAWTSTIKNGRGAFSQTMNGVDPFHRPIEYTPTDKEIIDRENSSARRLLIPHALVLQMLLSRFQAARYRRPSLMLLILRLVLRSAKAHASLSAHPLARETRFSFLLFGFETLKSSKMDTYCEHLLRQALYDAAFSWFSVRPQWTYGANRIQIDADIKLLSEFLSLLKADSVRASHHISSMVAVQLSGRATGYANELKDTNKLLRLLVDNEIYRLSVWVNPSNEARPPASQGSHADRGLSDESWSAAVRVAWKQNPLIAVYLIDRFKEPGVQSEVGRWTRANTRDVLDAPDALRFLIGDRLDNSFRRDMRHLLLWAPVTAVAAVSFFEPRFGNDPILLQYAHRVLEQHPVNVTFFFVPQVVQALRYDNFGYVERFIFETTKISQLFCHQIIWNMNANCFRDDGAEVEDSLKPTLDRITAAVVESLSGIAREFYDREFGFFNEVTSISGKLKPYIKRTKPEKKAKIDEEMAKIKVEVGVYLPSNPDGRVIDIDKKSGRPLQSHAKAPFMATFRVQKDRLVIKTELNSVLDDEAEAEEVKTVYDVWQQAIFKVGDDCRQDVLALQIIAMFKNIFTSVGLTLYLYPYRVTATAPGCGVIDVVPNATSRDEMGRAKINDLLGFFIAKYGGEDTTAFQRARLNFIQSMAAYSVACYILQIKDRHNGNIMIDGDGHIVHIDFGFLFDIGPGGVKFEPSSFKLNHEMVELMGGRYSQGYQTFQNLTVKAFLAIRPYADPLVNSVHLMLGTELPSFKGEPTIRRLRDRFALGLNERQAADYMMGVIKNAHENMRSTVYDEFQRIQNGIPYK